MAEGVPIDAFGVGSALITSEDHPALDIVYKLVDYDGRPVAKFSGVKSTLPGRKQVFRADGDPVWDVLSVREADESGRKLLEPVWRDGQALTTFDPHQARERAAEQVAELSEAWQRPPYPDDAPTPMPGTDLEWRAGQVRRAAFA
jgi:nicotinate phosphoribosyltransferase